jgi:hypothetical protein
MAARDVPLGLLPPPWERGGHPQTTEDFQTTQKLRISRELIFDKTLNKSILNLFRIVDFPVQQDAIVNAGCFKERELCEF